MKTYVSFYDIIDGIKQETGITNLSNRYNDIAKLIVRAERDINPYAGHFIRKNVLYKKGSKNFNGNILRVPDDFIELVSVSIPNSPVSIPTRDNVTHILICNGNSNELAVLSYWANQMDPEGKPYAAMNHFEAIVAFVVWKFYSQFVFQGNGNMNAKRDYKDTYEQFARASRGFDFFPTQENLDNIHIQQTTPRHLEINCVDDSCCINGLELEEPELIGDVWFWQEDSLIQVITESDVDDEFLSDKFSSSKTALNNGLYFTTNSVGRYGIAIKNGPQTPENILDITGLSIMNSVDYIYDLERSLLIIISKNYVTPGSFFLKLN